MNAFTGQITMFSFDFAPRFWSLCRGQIVPISQNTELFSLIADIYGGDARVSMGLPDLSMRSPVHFGQGPGLSNVHLGGLYGTDTQILDSSNLPPHNHKLMAGMATAENTDDSPDGSKTLVLPRGTSTSSYIDTPDIEGELSMGSTAIGTSGAGQDFSVTQPTLALNFSICLSGIYPTRN